MDNLTLDRGICKTRKKLHQPKFVVIGPNAFRFECWQDVLNVAIAHRNYLFFRDGDTVRAFYTADDQWGHDEWECRQ